MNLSFKELRPGFARQLRHVLENMAFPLANLEIEVTESQIMKFEHLDELRALHQLGIEIAMDDFGTGHSSLAQLKHLPISKLKIDRSFVIDIPDHDNDNVIVSTIIDMAHSLGLKVLAEGVETEQQQEFLISRGCDLLQGYLLNKPIPAEQFERILIEQLPLESENK